MFNKFKIKYKLVTLLSMVVIGLVVIQISSRKMFQKYGIGSEIDKKLSFIQTRIADLILLESNINRISSLFAFLINEENEIIRKKYLSEIISTEYEINRIFLNVISGDLNPEIKKDLLMARKKYIEFIDKRSILLTTKKRKKNLKYTALRLKEEIDKSIYALVLSAVKKLDLEVNEFKENIKLSSSTQYKYTNTIVILLLILIVSFGYFIILSITRPLAQLVDITSKISMKDSLLDLLNISVKVKDSKGDELGELGHSFNEMISKLKQAQGKLVTANASLLSQKQALDSSAIVAETDLKGKITYVNSKFLEISKYDREELMGQDHRLLNSGHHSKEFFKELWESIGNGEIWHKEVKNKAKGGSYYWVDTTIYPIKDEQGKLDKFIAIRFDITEKKQTQIELEVSLKKLESSQLQLIQSAKFASLGEMASGIAHEINNPLAVISASVKCLKKASDKKKLTLEMLNEIVNDIETTVLRINKIVTGLRTVSKESSDNNKEPVILRDIFEDVLGLCAEKFKNNGAHLNINLEDFSFDNTIVGDRVQLSQVFLYLLSNAYDAIENLKDKWVKINVIEQKDNFEIKVIDSGGGIPENVQERIFDPFYTSKNIGKGTGLGLSLSKSIVEKNDGTLQIDIYQSNTCFVVRLPKMSQEY